MASELRFLSSGWENPVVSQAAELLPGQSDAPEEHRCGRNQSMPNSRPQIGPECIPQTSTCEHTLPRFPRPLAGDTSSGATWPLGPPDLASVGPTVLGYLSSYCLREYLGLPSHSPDGNVETQRSAR